MDHSVQQRFRFLIVKYLENKCNTHELEELFTIIKDHREDKILSEIIDSEAETKSRDEIKIPEEISKSIFSAIQSRLTKTAQTETLKNIRPTQFPYWRIAAVLLVGIVCSMGLYLMFERSEDAVIKTAFGEIKEVVLPDQSVVTLNGNSLLRYDPQMVDKAVREVFISGEGFFQVAHGEKNQKFRVQTSNNVTIEVLGTEFNVNERQSLTRVVLHSGKILLGIQKKEGHKDILMSSGEYVEVNEDDIQIVRKQVDSRLYISWKNKMLIFKDTPLNEIITILESSYGIHTIVKDSAILNERFTATYPSDNIDVLIKALEKSFPIKGDYENRMITIGE